MYVKMRIDDQRPGSLLAFGDASDLTAGKGVLGPFTALPLIVDLEQRHH